MKFRIFLLGAVLLPGCATLPPPYQAPPPEATKEQRLEIADKYRVTHSFWRGYRLGGKRPSLDLFTLENYLAENGDEQAKSRMEWSRRTRMAGAAVMLSSLFFAPDMISKWRQGGDSSYSNSFWGFVGLYLLGAGITDYSIHSQIDPEVKAFNERLRKDLGLEEEDIKALDKVLNDPGEPSDDPRAFYAKVALGLSYHPSSDKDAYFTPATGPLGFHYEDDYESDMSFGGGYVWGNGLTLELDLGGDGPREGGILWKNYLGQKLFGENVSLYRIRSTLMAGHTFRALSISPAHPGIYTVGLKAGWAWLEGTRAYEDGSNTEIGSYAVASDAYVVGILARGTYPMTRHMSLGLEMGYDYNRFEYGVVSVQKGVYSSKTTPDLNSRGQQAFWDFSGPYARISLLMGRLPFIPKKKNRTVD